MRFGEQVNVFSNQSQQRIRQTPRLVGIVIAAVSCVVVLLAGQGMVGYAADASPTKRVLIVTGEDYPGHPWQQTTVVLKDLLEKDRRLRVDVLDDLSSLAAVDLTPYDSVVLHFKNYDPLVPGRLALDSLSRFVEVGGGLVVVHFACGAFQEHKDDFAKLVGRVWNPDLRGHDRRGKFRVDITAVKHPVTEAMEAFEADDELYTCVDGDTPITVLATAVSKVDAKTYPIAFVLSQGKGKVFHCLLGHDVVAFESDGTEELYRRGTLWTVGLEQEEE